MNMQSQCLMYLGSSKTEFLLTLQQLVLDQPGGFSSLPSFPIHAVPCCASYAEYFYNTTGFIYGTVPRCNTPSLGYILVQKSSYGASEGSLLLVLC